MEVVEPDPPPPPPPDQEPEPQAILVLSEGKYCGQNITRKLLFKKGARHFFSSLIHLYYERIVLSTVNLLKGNF